MKLTQDRALERLRGERPCKAAIFLTYTFDPIFFENEVLATILHLESDPEEHPARYHDEALRALQDAPVACLVDESIRRPGRRLPYDLRGIRSRTFHPKVALIVFEEFARLQVGSGNLTRSGYGDNTELSFVRDLRFDEPLDVALLLEVRTVIEAAHRLAGQAGTQLPQALAHLDRWIEAEPELDLDRRGLRFLHTEAGGPLLMQFLGLMPEDASITRIGALAPFLEKDDADWAAAGEAASVLGALADRLEADAVLDLGVSWERNSLERPSDPVPPFAARLNTLWARRSSEDDSVTYMTPTRITASKLRFVDAAGEPRWMNLDEAEDLRASGAIWPVGPVEIYAPDRIVRDLGGGGHLRLWLHPACKVQDARRVSRPLHAKLLLIATRRRGVDVTYVLVGSPNLSRRALLHGPPEGGNVETALAFAVAGHVTLHDVAPDLVHYLPGNAVLSERTFPEPKPTYGRLIEAVIYTAQTRTLTIRWSIPTDEPPAAWSLHYAEVECARGADWPRETGRTTIEDFALVPSTCELALHVNGMLAHVPILVEDLHALPTGPSVQALELRALLALLGRRIGGERLTTLRSDPASLGLVDAVLDGILGEGFGPTDVFRAWWGLASELEAPDLSLSGFRRTLLGALGARVVWTRLCEAAQAGTLGSEEVWFFGAELRRTLDAVEVPAGPDHAAKRTLLGEFLGKLRRELTVIQPSTDGRSWVGEIVAFYGTGT